MFVCANQACSSDVDGDGLINVNDLLSMLSQFGAGGAIPEDINGDSVVNVRPPLTSPTLVRIVLPSLLGTLRDAALGRR